MFPIFDQNKPFFLKCSYKPHPLPQDGHFEGQLQRSWQEQQESKEVSLANLTLLTEKIPKGDSPIKVGVSFSEGSNSIINIDLGDYKKLLGALESTAARRKHQILNALGNQILKLQKQVFVNWSQRDGFYNFNESNGFLETKYLPSNTLILTNSKPLYQILKPENSDETFNRHLSFPFPNEETFKFFTKEGNNNPLSTMYQRAKDLFKEEPFWGFYPPKQKDVTKSMKCKSDTKEFETILKDDSFDEPIFLLLINTRTQTPVESEVLFDSETKGHFNYLDVDDPNNLFFTKTLLSKLDTFITSSKLLTSYFGKLEVKNKQSILDPLQSIAPFVVGFKDDHQHQPPLANVDIFFNAVNENAFQMYLTPNTNAVTEWVSSHFLKEEVYPPSQNKSLNEGLIEILPNIKPFPLNPHRNRFEQPFILSATNFGSLNYLDLSTEKNSFMGDTQGAKSVVAILNYTSSKGFFLARDQAAADISIDGNDSNKWTNLKSLCFDFRDSVGSAIPLDTKSHLVVKIFNM